MSNNRQGSEMDEERLLVRSLSLGLPNRFRIDDHQHPWAQVVYAASGSLAVEANTRQWIVPPRRCLIVPPNVTHALEAIGETALRTLYLRPDHAERLTHPMGVFDVSPLVTELILETVRLGMLSETSDEQSAMATLLLAGLIKAPLLPLDLLMPTDIRARRVATKISRTLDLSSTVSELSKGTGASERTIERLFQAETGLSVGRWRQQARIHHAMRRLAEHCDVSHVANECGYESVSAFVAMFKQSVGMTPGQFRDSKSSAK